MPVHGVDDGLTWLGQERCEGCRCPLHSLDQLISSALSSAASISATSASEILSGGPSNR